MSSHGGHIVTEALVAGLRTRYDPTALAELRTLVAAPGFDWASLYQEALHEGVGPLFYAALRDRGVLPPALEARLRRDYITIGARNALVYRELGRVLQTLQGAGIDVLVLKGAALAEAVYRNAGVRPMVDVDLLVRRERVPAALERLEALGYGTVGQEARAGDTLTYENEVMLQRALGPLQMLLEVHWSLLDSPHHQRILPMAWFWTTSRPLSIGGAESRALGPEAQILHLSGHLLLHHGSGEALRLLWIYDIVEVVTQTAAEVDWDLLAAQASACDLVLPLQHVMSELAERWRLSLPGDALARLWELEPSAAERRVFTRLTSPQRPVAQRFAADLAALPDLHTRWRYAWHSLFPSPSYMMERYGTSPWLVPLTYPYRWMLGLWGWVSQRH